MSGHLMLRMTHEARAPHDRRSPGVLVTWRTPGLISGLAWDLAGEWMVRWTSATGWRCTCPGPADGGTCSHAARIRRLTTAEGGS